VDVGKLEFKAVLCWADGSFQRPWRIKSPGEIKVAVEKLAALHRRCTGVVR
jgi:hypothetical protein